MNASTAILVVDDNPSMTETLTDILQVQGYAAYAAYSAAEALEILQSQTIHVMLTDVMMPDMNGLELFRRTRATHPRLITFMMTGYAADDLIQQGIAEGVKSVLIKPLDFTLLLNLIQTAEDAYLRSDG